MAAAASRHERDPQTAPHSAGRDAKIESHIIPGSQGGTISAMVIEPLAPDRPSPCLIFYHGRAFVLEAASHHVHPAKQFALRTPCAVILPRYRPAPRHPFPEPLEDCYAAYEWAVANAAMLSIDPGRLAVGGDRAGGTWLPRCAGWRGTGLPLCPVSRNSSTRSQTTGWKTNRCARTAIRRCEIAG